MCRCSPSPGACLFRVPFSTTAHGHSNDNAHRVAGWYGFESEDALFEALRGYKPRGKFRGQFGLQKEQLARVPETDLQRLHGVKEELDAMFKQDEAFRSLDSKNKMRLARVKDRLVETLKASNEDYATGMNEYQNSSKLLNDFARGTQQFSGDRKPPKTVIKRIADLQGDEILKAPAMLFSQGSVADIRRAFKYVGSADEEAAWAMIRNRLDEVTAKIDMTSPSFGGGIWRALVKDPKTRNGLKAAMEELPGGEKKYRALMDWAQVMRDTDRMVYSNSQTTPYGCIVTRELPGSWRTGNKGSGWEEVSDGELGRRHGNDPGGQAS